MKEDKDYTLGDAVAGYLESLPQEEKKLQQRAVIRFVQWYGRDRLLSAMTPPDIAGYSQQFSSTDTDVEQKLKLLKAFFSFAVKKKWLRCGMVVHIKAKKKVIKKTALARKAAEVTKVTEQGLEKIQNELAVLKKKRPEVVAEISRAAADKDFRENAFPQRKQIKKADKGRQNERR